MALPEIKNMLRTCAFHLYGWACEDESVKDQAEAIRSGAVPQGYPGAGLAGTGRTFCRPARPPSLPTSGTRFAAVKQKSERCWPTRPWRIFREKKFVRCLNFGK